MTIRPAAISDLIVLSLRTIALGSLNGASTGTIHGSEGTLKILFGKADTHRGMATQDKEGNGQDVKRVTLPGGKMIEVVYFQEETAQGEQRSPERQLQVCPYCDSSLVYPTFWSEADQESWEVSLRCPNCEWTETEVFDQDTVERFDEELDRGTDSLVDDLKCLIRANMEEQIERFARALVEDHILPEDF